jgi:hypothetical protein
MDQRALQFKLRVRVIRPGTKGRAKRLKSTKGTETTSKGFNFPFFNPFSGFKPFSPAFSAGASLPNFKAKTALEWFSFTTLRLYHAAILTTWYNEAFNPLP